MDGSAERLSLVLYVLIVLAIAVLALAIRVAMLSRRMRKLSDMVIREHQKLDETLQAFQSAPYPGQMASQPPVQSAPPPSQGSQGMAGAPATATPTTQQAAVQRGQGISGADQATGAQAARTAQRPAARTTQGEQREAADPAASTSSPASSSTAAIQVASQISPQTAPEAVPRAGTQTTSQALQPASRSAIAQDGRSIPVNAHAQETAMAPLRGSSAERRAYGQGAAQGTGGRHVRMDSRARASQSAGGGLASTGMGEAAATGTPCVQPRPQLKVIGQVSGSGMQTESAMPLGEESAFIATYTAEAEAEEASKKGKRPKRRRPRIPFGANKNVQAKRDSYKTNAVDDDYDPDSIDFSRVRGYRSDQIAQMAYHTAQAESTARTARQMHSTPRQRRASQMPRERAYESARSSRQRDLVGQQDIQQAVTSTRASMNQVPGRLQEQAQARAQIRAQERLHREAEYIRQRHGATLGENDSTSFDPD